MDVPPFLGSSLAFMMVYVWGRRNQHVRMSFLGLFQFRAPYLPWVLLAFSVSCRLGRCRALRPPHPYIARTSLLSHEVCPPHPSMVALRFYLPGHVAPCSSPLLPSIVPALPTSLPFWSLALLPAQLGCSLLRQVLLGNSPSIDLMGIAVGHIYYFLEDVFPNTPGGRGRRPLATPSVLCTLLSLVTSQDADRYGAAHASEGVEIQPLAQEEEEG
jgi:hypothetical protein